MTYFIAHLHNECESSKYYTRMKVSECESSKYYTRMKVSERESSKYYTRMKVSERESSKYYTCLVCFIHICLPSKSQQNICMYMEFHAFSTLAIVRAQQ